MRNNPISFNDPSGHCGWDLCIIEGITLVTVAEVLLVGTAVTAFAYATNPAVREAVNTAAADVASGLDELTENALEKLRSLSKATGPKPLTDDEEKQVEKLTEGIDGFLEEHPDLPEEAQKVADGEELLPGKNHVREAQDFARGLQKGIDALNKVRNRRTEEAQQAIDDAISHAKEKLEYLKGLGIVP